MERFVSFLGLITLMLIAWLFSSDKKKMNFRLIVSGVLLQFVFAVVVLWTKPGKMFFDGARVVITKVVSFSDAGAAFVFGDGFREHYLAFSVLPTIIFVSSITAMLFHLGIIQFIVKIMAKIMVKVMDASGSESLVTSANVFVGMTEAPLLIRPYIETMTKSEIMVMMTGGMATIAGGVMAAYAGMGIDPGHLLSASIMSAPAAIVIAKIMIPENEESVTKGTVKVEIPKNDANIIDAACRGAGDGLKLALNVAAMLIAFIAIVHLVNWGFSVFPDINGEPLTLQRVLGWICSPLAWLLGVHWKDADAIGALLGEKIVLNEFIAYANLIKMKGMVSERSFTIATYALCGFANFGSVAITVGGIGSLVPGRRRDFARLGLKAMLGGALAGFMTAAVAGMLI